jgi:hypothetical protein
VVREIHLYCQQLRMLGSEQWLESEICKIELNERQKKFLKVCILRHPLSDVQAARVLYGRYESVSHRYRAYVTRLARKLEGLIIHYASNTRISPRNAQALLVSRKSYLANILMRTGAPLLGVKHFYDVDELAVLPETAWFVPQALYALALTKAQSSNHRITAKLLARARHAVDEAMLIATCDEYQIQISAYHGISASRRAKRERVSRQARSLLMSMNVRSMGIRSTIAASRLAAACSQSLDDKKLGLLWAERFRRACLRFGVWNVDMNIEYHNQRILIWECAEEHSKVLTEMEALLPFLKRNTATWFQITDSYAKTLIKLGRFDDAYNTLNELVHSSAYVVHSPAERSYTDLRYAYMQQLIESNRRLPSPRRYRDLEDKHGIHLLVLTLIHGLRCHELEALDSIVTSLRRTVLRNKLGRHDSALNVFSRLLQKLVNTDFDIEIARKSSSFSRLEARLDNLLSAGIPAPIVPWGLLWKSLLNVGAKH